MTTKVFQASYLDFYAPNKLVEENEFIHTQPDKSPVPSLHDPEVRAKLPSPYWHSPRGEKAVECYWKTWQIAFSNLQRVHAGNKFISPFIDTAFNSCLFMWDSCFILKGLRYGSRAFNFQRTLDNLYAKQHPDGFISREIQEWDGQDRFHRFDPASTGPNILAWSEWEYYLVFHDKERLRKVFPVLLAYHIWCRNNRSWPDGSYFSCGLACGMDNQPRVLPGESAWTDHSFSAWVDATAHACLSARLLARMAEELGQTGRPEVADCRAEAAHLAAYMQKHMWDPANNTFADRRLAATRKPGVREHSDTRTVGAYWALLADVVAPERLQGFIDALDDPALFNRPVRVPSLAANHPDYRASGGYWLGGVWPPTTYMVLRGLTKVGYDDVAADVGANYHDAVVKCFEGTGTVWENMAPELAPGGAPGPDGRTQFVPVPGDPAKGDFVGWGALGPIAILYEYVFGIRADVPGGQLTWDVRLTDAFGVRNYPFGASGVLDLECDARPEGGVAGQPTVRITSNVALRVVLHWGKSASTEGGKHVDRSGVPRAPLHTRVIDVPAGRTVECKA